MSDVKILVVDDSQDIVIHVTSLLKELGYNNLHSTTNPLEAFEMVQNPPGGDPFKLVISDQVMPECKGTELLGKIRKTFTKDQLPFILLTSDNSRQSVMQLVAGGGNSYIVKPVAKETLSTKIAEVLK
jgi:PleD family two-component response regulator